MKKLNLIAALLLSGIYLITAPAYAINPTCQVKPVGKSGKVLKGAANPTELARSVFQAIQQNRFEDLNALFLDDDALQLLKQRGSEDIKALLEDKAATDFKDKLKTDFQNIIQQGISQTINWSEIALAETKLGPGSPKSPMVQPVTLTLTNKAKQPVQLILETAKVNNRYYLFQRMALKS